MWDSVEDDRRGDDLYDLTVALGLQSANKGSTPTFEDHYSSWVVDVTLVSPSLHVFSWSFLRHTKNLSDHQYIVPVSVGWDGVSVRRLPHIDAFEKSLMLARWSIPPPSDRQLLSSIRERRGGRT